MWSSFCLQLCIIAGQIFAKKEMTTEFFCFYGQKSCNSSYKSTMWAEFCTHLFLFQNSTPNVQNSASLKVSFHHRVSMRKDPNNQKADIWIDFYVLTRWGKLAFQVRHTLLRDKYFFWKLVNKRMHRQHGVSFSRQIALVFLLQCIAAIAILLILRLWIQEKILPIHYGGSFWIVMTFQFDA